MNDNRGYSRINRYQKRRNNKRSLLLLSSLALLFIVLLISLIALNKGKQDNNTDQQPQDLVETSLESDESNANESEEDGQGEDNDNETVDRVGNEENETTFDDENSDSEESVSDEIEVIEDSSDDNVIRAYTGNWEPIGTSQVGEHVTNYNDGSDDRIEIKRATSNVTGIAEEDMIEWWVGNDGPQKVFSVISDKEKTDYYKVYLFWIDREGWQVTKVEKIKEFKREDYE